MKFLIDIETAKAFGAYDDSARIELQATQIVVERAEITTYILDRSVTDSALVESMALPDGWQPWEYKVQNGLLVKAE